MPKKEAMELIQAFQMSIQQVITEKKERIGKVEKLKKEEMQKAEKKRVIELFVENDTTLAHLLEFISNKLLDIQPT